MQLSVRCHIFGLMGSDSLPNDNSDEQKQDGQCVKNAEMSQRCHPKTQGICTMSQAPPGSFGLHGAGSVEGDAVILTWAFDYK